MSEFHDDYPQYEMAHHSEEEGKVIRKKLWRVFWIMLIITLIELFVGFKAYDWGLQDIMGRAGMTLKLTFILFTVLKAAYIVMSFMHLGDEKRALKWVILAPYTTFILYLVFMTSVSEGTYSFYGREKMDKQIVNQAEDRKAGLNKHHGSGNGQHQEESHSGEHH